MSNDPTKVRLGSREYTIVAQGIGRIRRKLTQILRLVDQGGEDGLEVSELSGELYEAVKVFVPDLAPEWELLGYAGPEAFERRSEPGYVEPDPDEEIVTPTVPEISELLETIYRVNGGERLVRLLGNVIGLDLIRAKLRQALANWTPSSTSSASSPSTSAGAPSISSSTSEEAPNGNGGSHSPASSPSSTPEIAGGVAS